MGDAVGKLYVERHFPPDAKARMDELVANLRRGLPAAASTTLDWMTPETRERALAKLDKFTPKIGYPDAWRDYSGAGDRPRRPVRQRRAASAVETTTASWPSSAARSTATSGS